MHNLIDTHSNDGLTTLIVRAKFVIHMELSQLFFAFARRDMQSKQEIHSMFSELLLPSSMTNFFANETN